ncbi:MAG: PAS domain-containing protein [Saprospiraceae bacterium]|nr:PAS domain-containing protein [Saprospiraceae bacterium]
MASTAHHIVSPEWAAENPGLAFFQAAFEHSPLLAAIMESASFRLLYANPRVVSLFGYSASELASPLRFFLDNMEKQAQDELLQKLQSLGSEEFVNTVLNIRDASGQWMQLRVSFTAFRRDANHAPVSYLAIAEDISSRMGIDRQRGRLEQMVKLAEEHFQFGKWEYNLDTRHHYLTDGIYDIADLLQGADRTDFDPRDFLKLLLDGDDEKVIQRVKQCIHSGEAFSEEVNMQTHTGVIKRLRIYVKPMRAEDQHIHKLLGVVWDITEEYQTREKLRKSTIQLSDAEQLLQFGTWEWDMSEGLVKWSENFWNLLEYPYTAHVQDWMPIDRFYQHIQPEDKVEMKERETHSVRQMTANEDIDVQEFRLRTFEGNVRYFISSTRVIARDAQGNPVKAIGYSADVTDMKNIQHNLEKKISEIKRAYEETEQFSYVASHDLQEPLRKVTAFGERLKTRCGANFDEDCQMYLDRMMDATGRMRLLIDNLLTLSRTKRTKDLFVQVDLGKILTEVMLDVDLKIHEKSAQIHVGEMPVIEGIPTQLQQLFQNILLNALKFSKSDIAPEIEVRSSLMDARQMQNSLLDERQEYVLISIRDNGIGFEPQYAETIFSPFKKLHSRSEYEGTGIGLAICKKVVQNHGGALWAESLPGEGATFYIALPKTQAWE